MPRPATPKAINGTDRRRWYFRGNDKHVVTTWEPYVGYLAFTENDSGETWRGVGPTRLAAIADLAESMGLSD